MNDNRERGLYERCFKRPLDFVLAVCALVVLSPIMALVALLVRIKLGSPVLFTQPRPGLVDEDGNENIFKMYKFRSMTDEKDENGELLPDEVRLTGFGKILRSTSLDELPELINIIKGDMSFIGPRPQLVRDMVFMTAEQRRRHLVRPGLSGLAQIRGRNAISWDKKLSTDLEYISRITFWGDCKIIIGTFLKVLQRDGIVEEGMATAEDLGDYLLRIGKLNNEDYMEGQEIARRLLEESR